MTSVDVIVPCYRYGRFLRHCVESVLAQSGVDVRVLIIDDCSPDNTADVAELLRSEDSRVTFVRHAVNLGHIATYNEGIEWTRSQYYLLLSADDYLLPGALERSAAFLDRHPAAVLAFGQAIVANEEGGASHTAPAAPDATWKFFSGAAFIEWSGARNCVPTPTAVVRTAVQKKVGGYRPELPHTGDMEMWLRLAAKGGVGMTLAFHAVYRRHASNMSLQYMASHWLPDLEQRAAALRSFFSTAGLESSQGEELRRKTSRALAEEALKFASSAFNSGDLESSLQLSDFARKLSPGIRTSAGWAKLTGKRAVGVATWLGVRNSLSRLRNAAPAE